jgi:hypothetical protein
MSRSARTAGRSDAASKAEQAQPARRANRRVRRLTSCHQPQTQLDKLLADREADRLTLEGCSRSAEQHQDHTCRCKPRAGGLAPLEREREVLSRGWKVLKYAEERLRRSSSDGELFLLVTPCAPNQPCRHNCMRCPGDRRSGMYLLYILTY